ncbi:hypothetical protein ACQVRV_00320 (plasmid) [Ralstonia pseudosolanacearum]
MSDLPMDALLGQVWAMAAPYLGGAWDMLQRAWADAPKSLLIGIVLGLVLARLLRALLIVAGLGALACACSATLCPVWADWRTP